MLSGDASAAAGRVATELGLDGFEAPLKPDEKLAALERIMASQKARSGRRRKTAFAGDGINDAPSLARADVGISFGSGATRAAMEASDLAIAESDLRLLPEAIRLARRTRAVLYSNVALALGCKLILIATGLSGLTGIWEAVLGDVGVTLLAVLNSARLIGRSKRI
jgi:Cd2+/Zn2+-exporting ATPase